MSGMRLETNYDDANLHFSIDYIPGERFLKFINIEKTKESEQTMTNYIPYEWYALLLMVLGSWNEVTAFENALKKAYCSAKSGKNLKTPIILWGPAGSGKSTILNILEFSFKNTDHVKELRNVIFAHDVDFTKVSDPDDAEWNWIMSYPVVFAASNRIPSEELFNDRKFIFGTTGRKFEKEVYEAVVKVCEKYANDIYRYYADNK